MEAEKGSAEFEAWFSAEYPNTQANCEKPDHPNDQIIKAFAEVSWRHSRKGLASEADQLKSNYDQVAAAYTELREAMFSLETQGAAKVAGLKAEIESLKAQLVERESLYQNAMAGRIRATELLEVATAEVAELRSQLEHADENVVALEKQNKALMQKYEPMRKDAERLDKATAFVKQLCDSAGNQPSVATGYLHDILSAMSEEAANGQAT